MVRLLSIAIVIWTFLDINANYTGPTMYCGEPVDILRSIQNVYNSEILFSLKLYKSFINGNESFILSTANSFVSFLKLYYGTRGKLQQQIGTILELRIDPDNAQFGVQRIVDTIKSANSTSLGLVNEIIYRNDLSLIYDFEYAMNMTFRSNPRSYDFTKKLELKRVVKEWYKNNTLKGYVAPKIAKNITDNKSLVLVGDSHYYATWAENFEFCSDEVFIFYYGAEEPLYLSSFLQRFDSYKYGNLKNADAEFVEIPLKNIDSSFNVSLFIILPNTDLGLEGLEQYITTEPKILELLFKGTEQKVFMTIPRFKLSTTVSLYDQLRKINSSEIFNETAEFTKIINGPGITVDATWNSAAFDFPNNHEEENEERVYECNDPGWASDIQRFALNHPFMMIYAIRGMNPIILSMARITGVGNHFYE